MLVFLRRREAFGATFDRWSEEEMVEPDYRQDRSALTLDVFSDGRWGDERSTRSSTRVSRAGILSIVVPSQ